MMSSLVMTLYHARIAERERGRAERRFREVRKLAHKFVFEIHDAIANIPGSGEAQRALAGTALEQLDVLAQESASDVSLQRELATAYLRTADLTVDVTRKYDARARALALYRNLIQKDPENRGLKASLLGSHLEIADSLKLLGQSYEALTHTREAVTIARNLRRTESKDAIALRSLSEPFISTGIIQQERGHFEEAAIAFRRATEEAAERVLLEPGDDSRRHLAICRRLLGNALSDSGKYAEAMQHYTLAKVMFDQLYRLNPLDVRYQRDRWSIYWRMGAARAALGEPAAGTEMIAEAISLMRNLVAADPGDSGHKRWLALTHLSLGTIYGKEFDPRAALAEYEKAVTITAALEVADHASAEARADLGISYVALADALIRIHEGDDARSYLRRARPLLASCLRSDPENLRVSRAMQKMSELMKTLETTPT